ncbi:MAG: aspartate kinase, partial [Candidatus Sulfotelmatobacter sp.]
MKNLPKDHAEPAGLNYQVQQISSDHLERCASHSRRAEAANRPFRVMKFGGTSVGDAACIRKVVEIVRAAARDSQVVVVVSAMSGVTNKLVEAASQSELGCDQPVAEILEQLRRQHRTAAEELIQSSEERNHLHGKIEDLLRTYSRLCKGTKLLRELTPRTRDAILGLGERLSVLLVAAALTERGVASAAIDATEIVVTDDSHGAAEPCMELTQKRCEARVRPLLQSGVVPVVTGFIGATAEGILTTLGRGGSDYSATILGAALASDEVIIWTDVDGLQTADPRLVPEARTITEVSYREAAELAYFGAKVLHPKTLRPVMQCGIPLWIRNTFAPEKLGTRITPQGLPGEGGVKAITAIRDAALISIKGPALAGIQNVVGRSIRAMAAVRADVLLISQASSQNDLTLLIPLAQAKAAVEEMRHEFAHDLKQERTGGFKVDPTVSLITVVGKNMSSLSAIVPFALEAFGRAGVSVAALARGSSECTLSFVVARHEMEAAVFS